MATREGVVGGGLDSISGQVSWALSCDDHLPSTAQQTCQQSFLYQFLHQTAGKFINSCDSVNMPPSADPGRAHEDVETTPEFCIAELSNRLKGITADAEPHPDAS